MKINKVKVLLTIYIFIVIFQPPVLPVNFVYISGSLTLLYFLKFHGWKIKTGGVLGKSNLYIFYRGFICALSYLAVVSVINVLNGNGSYFSNRLHCINQLAILTAFDLLFVWFVLVQFERYGFGFADLIHMIGVAGAVQGICAVLSYLFPAIRNIFMTYQSGIMGYWYSVERRGYGFSGLMLDTFGYGMGLIAGTVLLSGDISKRKKIIYVALSFLATLLNARSGVVIFAIAAAISLMKTRKIKYLIPKTVMAAVIVVAMLLKLVPVILEWLKNSTNLTLEWMGIGLSEAYGILLGKRNVQNTAILSKANDLPGHLLELLFGTGHNVYGVTEITGFHTDNGYVNLLWEFGVIGSVCILLFFIYFYYRAFSSVKLEKKFLVIFLALAYFIMMIKAVLIGYNPGTVVHYFVLFSMIYFREKKGGYILKLKYEVKHDYNKSTVSSKFLWRGQ